MEMNGEKILKKGKKTPKWIIVAYIICILAILGATGSMIYKEENHKKEPIDFTTEGALNIEENQYASLKVEGLTDEVAIYGDVENESSPSNDRYYIAISEGYFYIVDLNYETIEQLKQIQEYTYSTDENAQAPEPVIIYGMTEKVPHELKKMVIDYYNESVEEEYKIKLEDFDMYFGNTLLNVRRTPIDAPIENAIIVIAIIAIITIVIVHIVTMVNIIKNLKYIKKNGYKEDIASQLDDNVEGKYYKDKVILTKDYLVDIKNGLKIIKYSDVKWVHTHNVKYYGAVTVSTSIIAHLKDGKTNIELVEIKGGTTDEFIEIFNKVCEKVPEDCLKGYTQENITEFKNYKKSLKNK